MREFEPTMISQTDVFPAQLLRASQQEEIVEMTSRCKYLAMNVIGLLAFGSSWKTQTSETLQILPRSFASLNPRVYLLMTWPKTHNIDPGVQWLVKERIEKFRGILTGIISDRMALPIDSKHDLPHSSQMTRGLVRHSRKVSGRARPGARRVCSSTQASFACVNN